MGRSDLARDYATHEARAERQRALDDEIARWTATFGVDDLLARLRAHEVPAGLINRAPDLAADPHIAAREMIVRVAAGFGVDVPMTNVVPRFSRTPGAIRAVGPELGAHTDEVLSEFYGPDEIAALRAASIIT
jgi:crotonobetainyl-CoA:carnitine CoA-transferase CaiB-like acyl-CoA transferase